MLEHFRVKKDLNGGITESHKIRNSLSTEEIRSYSNFTSLKL